MSAFRILIASLCLASAASAQVVSVVKSPPAERGALYTSNREPLAPSPFVKLPIGSIEPRGWLLRMLELQRDGMVGHLPEISRWCNFEGNAWAHPQGEGHSGWEEMPYWLKGYGDLGYVLKDPKIREQTSRWIDAIIATQREDGWFGPRGLLTSLEGKPDLWPNMIVLNILQSWHDVTADPRIIPFMTRYFRWQVTAPEADFLVGYWPKLRGGDNLESIYWLYNRTGDAWLLELATKVHKHTADWTGGVINWHGVNITQGFREPAIYWMQAREQSFRDATERNYQTVMTLYGQVPGGMFGADENARKGYDDPRQAAETCSMVEFMHSFQMLTKIAGNPIWADRCEDVAFNSLPAAITPDFKALHYLTSPNMVQLDRGNKAPGIQNGGMMLAYSPGAAYRCCQHNVAHGWPYYAQEMWLATSDKGLCASLYGASEVTAKVADGTTVKIAQATDYPFSDQVALKVSAPKAVRFPLYLRVPQWCDAPQVQVNGKPLEVKAEPLSYIVLDRTWADGDEVKLRLPMKLVTHTWAKNKNSVSIDYGPLTFSLKIGEDWKPFGSNKSWPDWEVFPTTPWNYGLAIDPASPTASLQIKRKETVSNEPFRPENAPIEIVAQGRRIPQWKQETTGLIRPLQMSPAKTAEPVEQITLIPMGAARLRISAFPVASTSADAHEWIEPVAASVTASHVFEGDSVEAIADGLLPKSSNDPEIPRFTWWNHRGTAEWVQWAFKTPRKVSGVEVYWFDDTGRGQCRLPQSWRVLYKDGDQWKPVANPTPCRIAPDQFNKTTFDAVQTTALRLEVQLQPQFSGGILEWRVIE